jgi:hypothetical protein
MSLPRQTFLVHVLAGGPRAVVQDVGSRVSETVPDVRAVGERIAELVDERDRAPGPEPEEPR